MTEVKIALDGKSFVWTGTEWCEDATYILAPEAIVRKLNPLLTKRLEGEDFLTSDIDTLLSTASQARDAMQYERAERLVRRCLQLSPGHLGVLAILCSTLRARGQPAQALKETSRFRSAKYPPLLISRAAAYCDLKQWEDAKRELGRTLAIQTASEEAFSVVRRIKAARPDLYIKPK